MTESEDVITTRIEATERPQSDERFARELAERMELALGNARLLEASLRATDNLREVNQQMVTATIQAQELAEQANAERERSEQGERELREVAEFRERFIGILGHDLRNPLSAINMTAKSLLHSDQLSERDKLRVARILRSGERMSRMISQLLDLTRARLGGGFPLELRPADLGEVCRGVVEEFGGAIDLRVDGDLTGTWDPDRLAEVISNITGNAMEHAAPGTRVVVTARAAGSEAVVEIVNKGAPIPPDLLPFIFEPFRQGRPRESATTGNLGLGLYIAKQIVMSMGGTLDARSIDRTTTFVVRLPHTMPVARERRSEATTFSEAPNHSDDLRPDNDAGDIHRS